ncbi:MAG: RNA methyltransferase [Planctomycetota bacterium]
MYEPSIRSTKNPVVRRAREAREGRLAGLLLAEGVRLVEEAAASGLEVVEALISPRLLTSERGAALAAALERGAGRLLDTTDEILERCSALKTHQGVLAFVRQPSWEPADFVRGERPFLLAACGVQDPGNLGGLVRTAEAAGASGFVALRGSAHPFRDKALRGSAGSVFRLPCWPDAAAEDLLAFVEEHGVTLVATDGATGTELWDMDFGPAPQLFLLGAEGGGIPKRLRERCARFVRIPMRAPVDSLNVSVAAGVVLYELARRRRGAEG